MGGYMGGWEGASGMGVTKPLLSEAQTAPSNAGEGGGWVGGWGGVGGQPHKKKKKKKRHTTEGLTVRAADRCQGHAAHVRER